MTASNTPAVAIVAVLAVLSSLAQAVEYTDLEAAVLLAVNEHRATAGLAPQSSHPEIVALARRHSLAMARGEVVFGHEGMSARMDVIVSQMAISSMAENVSRHTREATRVPAAALRVWRESEVHRKNMEGPHDLTGIGAARSADGTFYLTQIFVRTQPQVSRPGAFVIGSSRSGSMKRPGRTSE